MCLLPLLLLMVAQTFDVATMKPSPPPSGGGARRVRIGSTGGPGTSDPGFYKCVNCTVATLVMDAYDLKPYQLIGASLEGDRFEVTARVPEGATKEQFRLMLQNLLAERFSLKAHHETREMPKYDLVIAKGGPKLKPAVPEKTEGAGFTMSGSGLMTARIPDYSTEQFATYLSRQIGKPVTDMTALKGKYDIVLSYSRELPGQLQPVGPGMLPPPPPPLDSPDSDAGPALFSALQEQLGLKLEPKKGPVDVLVVDHAEKRPAENE